MKHELQELIPLGEKVVEKKKDDPAAGLTSIGVDRPNWYIDDQGVEHYIEPPREQDDA